MQELLGGREREPPRHARHVAAGIFCLRRAGGVGPVLDALRRFNQLLAALTLLAVSVWLHRCGRRYWFTLVPMLFVMTITLWALMRQGASVAGVLYSGAVPAPADVLNGLVALALFGLAGLLIADGGRALISRPPADHLTTPREAV